MQHTHARTNLLIEWWMYEIELAVVSEVRANMINSFKVDRFMGKQDRW